MAHGYPDFGFDKQQTAIQLLDTGELASRLGSIDRFDRAGSVIFMDNGNAHLSPYTVNNTANLYVERVIDGRIASNSALRFYVGAMTNGPKTLILNVPFNQLSLVGLEFMFMYHRITVAQLPEIYVNFEITTASHGWWLFIWFDWHTYTVRLQVMQGGNLVWIPIWGLQAPNGAQLPLDRYVNIKIVMNANTGKVSHVAINGDVVPLSDCYGWDINIPGYSNLGMWVETSNVWNTGYFYMGDLIITTDDIERI